MAADAWVIPDWPAPPGVKAAVSTRQGPGVSPPPYERFNLGLRNGDDPDAAAANRAALVQELALARSPHWLRQVHGVDVLEVGAYNPVDEDEPCADAAVTSVPDQPLVILTADCLPALFCSKDGTTIGAAHAGWRGLLAGVLEATVARMPVSSSGVMAWLGPCIGAASYEVGEEVRSAFVEVEAGAASCFVATRPGHWLCDLAGLARQRLEKAGVTAIYGGHFDTLTDPRFYSYRGEGARSGRFASVIWLE